MKRYLFVVVLVGLAIGVTFGLLIAKPTMHVQGSEAKTSVDVSPSLKGQTRTYYIAADEVQWDYAPSGTNQITGEAFDDDANVFVENGEDRIGKIYLKSQYREYTDETFTTQKLIAAKWQH